MNVAFVEFTVRRRKEGCHPGALEPEKDVITAIPPPGLVGRGREEVRDNVCTGF